MADGTHNLNYHDFLRAKVKLAEQNGFEVSDSEINPILKPHQRDMVRWLMRIGRGACFAAFGLGKSVIQLEAVRLTLVRTGGMGLIVIPLGVRQEFMRDAAMLGTPIKFIRRLDETSGSGIYLTNYETVRDGKLDPRHFTVASLDEASVLRGFGGTKTFREFMALFAGDRKTMNERVLGESVKYRFVATATPSPNDFIELLAYSAFLGVMDVGQAKTRFFRRNSEKADELTLHPHKEREFWLWVASWALFVQKPSDLGHSDEGYTLPEMEIHWHEIPDDHADAGFSYSGQGLLLKEQAIGVVESAREKRESLSKRIDKMLEIVNAQREKEVSPRVLPEEPRHAAGSAEATAAEGGSGKSGTEKELPERVLPEEQGAVAGIATGTEPSKLQGKQACLQGQEPAGGPKAIRADSGRVSGHSGCSGRRLRDMHSERQNAEDGGGSLPPDRENSRHPLQSVQHRNRPSRGASGADHGSSGLSDQIIIWCDLNDEQRAIEKGLEALRLSYSSLYGAQDIETRDALITAWRDKRTSVFLTKPVMYGAGVNLQQCHTMIFAGIGFKAQDFMQAIHRIHRFQQQHRCIIHVIYTEAEREVRRILEAKWDKHKETVQKMTEIIREYGLSTAAMAETLRRAMGVERIEVAGRDFRIINNDCVLETAAMPDNSLDMVLTSIPFSTQYEYSPNYADFGHTDNNAHFFTQMDYLTPHLLRTLKPGRVAAIHVKDRIVPGGLTGLGYQTVYPFHAKCIEHYTRHGFGYMGMITIVTDVVRENNQTYRLGWSEVCKDGSKISAGLPEYLLLFRKTPTDTSNAYADDPVIKSKETYSRSRWQTDAHGFWRSGGNRLLTPEELENLDHDVIFRWFRDYHLAHVYDYEHHVKIGETIDAKGRLPVTFMLLQPPSWMDDVWTDVARMRTLNMLQSQKGKEQHLCPMQFDVADRVIERFTNKGETVYDPFGGIMSVPYRAILKGRKAIACELSTRYFMDGAHYLQSAERERSMPGLFDIQGGEAA